MTDPGEMIAAMIAETTMEEVAVTNTEAPATAVGKVATAAVPATTAVDKVATEETTTTVPREALATEASKIATITSLAVVMTITTDASTRVAEDPQTGTAVKVSRTQAHSPVSNLPHTKLQHLATMVPIGLAKAAAAMAAEEAIAAAGQTSTTTRL